MIKLDEVSKIYISDSGSAIGIQNVSANFDINEFVVITGESGSGKSTLLNVVSLFDSYEEGELFINGKSTIEFSKEDFVKYQANYVSFVFQDYNLIDSFSVFDNVMLPLLSRGLTRSEAKKKVNAALKEIGISHLAHRKCSKLSGGEKQRTVIARALVSDTPVLACDEPTGNLDSKTSEDVVKVIKKIAKDHLILYVTHDYDSVKDVATRHIVMKDGHIVKDERLAHCEEEPEVVIPIKKHSKLSSDIKVGIDDVVHTPKRSILTFTVAFITSLFIMSVLFGLSSSLNSLNLDEAVTTSYVYPDNTHNEKKSIVYTTDTSKSDINGIVSPEVNLLDYGSVLDTVSSYTLNIADQNNGIYCKQFRIAGEISSSYQKVSGEAPIHVEGAEHIQCALVLPKGVYSSSVFNLDGVSKRLLNSIIVGNVVNPEVVKTGYQDSEYGHYMITGIYYDPVLNGRDNSIPYLCFAHEDLAQVRSDVLDSYQKSNINFLSAITFYYRDLKAYINGDEMSIEATVTSETDKILIPLRYQNLPLTMSYRGTVISIPSSDIEFTPSYLQSTSLYVNPAMLISLFANSTLFASVYAPSEAQARNNEQVLIAQGYNATNSNIPLSSSTAYNYGNIILCAVFLTLFILLGVLVAFLSSLVFRSIYNSKKKDYAIYQTLAFTRSDIKRINLVEMLLQFIISSLISYVALLILVSLSSGGILESFSSVLSSPIYVVIFFVLNIAFASFCSLRIMNKMEKKTLANNIHKGGELL